MLPLAEKVQMNFHDLFGTHTANLKTSHWSNGQFVSACTRCDRPMIKPPGEPWRIASDAGR